MKRLIFLLAVICLPPVGAVTPALVHTSPGSSFPLTITSTGSGHAILLVTDSAATPATITATGGGNQSMSLQGSCVIGVSTTTNHVCSWLIANSNSGQTSITCGTNCTVTRIQEYEYSGTDTTSPLDHISVCSWAVACSTIPSFTPNYSAEAVVTAWTCSGSASSLSGSNVTWLNTDFTAGEAGGQAILTSLSTITSLPDAGCGADSGLIIGLKGSGTTQTCAADPQYYDYSSELGSSGNPTISGNINQVGDLVLAVPWCINGASDCNVTSVTAGSDTMTVTNTGTASSVTGKGFIYYDLSATAAGAKTLTFTPSGTRVNTQLAYYDFTAGSGCTWSHDTDSSVGTGSGTVANTPSITPTTGALLYNFTYTATHVNMTASNSTPWKCLNYNQSSETGNCMIVGTQNAQAYVLSASSGSTANNINKLNNDAWQAIISSFKLTGTAASATLPQVFVIHP